MQQDRSIREQLVDAGLWDIADLRDPSESDEAANELRGRCEEAFHCKLTITNLKSSTRKTAARHYIYIGGKVGVLAEAVDFPKAICRAAMELHRRFGISSK